MNTKLFISIVLLSATTFFSCQTNTKNKQMAFEKTSVPVEKLDSLISVMTLDEKLSLIHASSSFTSGGVSRLGIPEIVMSDGPHGVRHEHGRGWYALEDADDKATYLPVGICLSSTWNKALGYDYGVVLGSEAKERGKNVILGPGVNIIRSPLNGRNFEYLSEDPFHAAAMAIGYVKGVQDQGTAACVKHFAANNQETDRHNIDAIVSKRALHEIYFPAFKAAVQDGGAWSIMGAYNKVNGQYTTHHEYLNNVVLKGEWGFDGVVISDWGSVKDTREALLYGTDIEMGTELLKSFSNPDYDDFYLAKHAKKMIEDGIIDESVIDEKVKRVLTLMYRSTALGNHAPGKRNVPEHQQLALKVAQEGLVLLKNDGLLPLDKKAIKTLAVIGHNATRLFAERGGSSQVKPLYEITPLEGIQKLVGDQVEIIFAEGYEPYYDESLFRSYTSEVASQSRDNKKSTDLAKTANAKLMQEAIEVARSADAVIFVGGWIHGHDGMPWGEGTYDAEARDKLNLKLLFGQEELIQEINKVNKKTAVVLMGGSNVEMKNWLPETPAYLHAWYPGMEGGTAIAQVLFGDINPSGKLPVTFANSHEDYPSHAVGEFPGNKTVQYTEDIYVGYRYFDSKNIEVVFPFGFGLSYTSFDFSGLKLTQKDKQVFVECTITNTGNRAGAEVAQVYVHQKVASVERPVKELKGFEKVTLNPGESATISIVLDESAFSFYHPEKLVWVLEPGLFEISVGSASNNLPLKGTVEITQ
jgi:beta-glucosidase